jgi:chemotaxis protein methyltransferase CheR
MDKKEIIREAQIAAFLEAVRVRHGYDFHHYSRASFARRLERAAEKHADGCVGELIKRVFYDEELWPLLLSDLTVTVSEMFRDPPVWQLLAREVLPLLATYPSFRIWIAGCATGEEVYSMAILLEEAQLSSRALIFATDINPTALRAARLGVFKGEDQKIFTENYANSGGKRRPQDYFTPGYEAIKMAERLKDNIVFSEHNLLIDDVFSEVHLVLCRNVLIYFDAKAQQQALDLFTRSLIDKGHLCLGTKESLRFTTHLSRYQEIVSGLRLFQKLPEAQP